ncbi:MAG: hypothetical protein ACD_75C00672G0005 [uncultured bacterium]|nr:MAG: hypothetical protein ACD_75C00672G0005 [uncultured bacterium]
MRAFGAKVRMTPFTTPTYSSARPKSVIRVTMGTLFVLAIVLAIVIVPVRRLPEKLPVRGHYCSIPG